MILTERKRIGILTTGGTISSLNSPNGLKPAEGVIEYILEGLSFDKDTMVSKDKETEVKVIPILNKDSTNITLYDQAHIANEIFSLDKKYDGIVITHGTDTMQFTSSMLSIMLESPDVPIVLTGSMKTIKDQNTDASKNLMGAIISAKSQLSGVFIFFHGNLIPGSLAYETTTDLGLTFKSAVGNVATLKNNKLIFEVEISEAKTLLPPLLNTNFDSSILTVTLSPSCQELSVKEIDKRHNGVILLSYGSAGVPKHYVNTIHQLIERKIPVVLSSQVNSLHIGHGNYEINKVAEELGITSGLGLYSFDYANMANSLGMLRVQRTNPKDKLNKFEEIFNKNIQLALNQKYIIKSNNYKKIVEKISNYSESGLFMEMNSLFRKPRETIQQSKRLKTG